MRQTARHAQPSPTQPALFRSADDRYLYFALILADQKPWKALVEWMDSAGLAADLVDPEYSDLAHRQRNFGHVQEMVEVFFMLHDADHLYHEGQRRGLPIGVDQRPRGPASSTSTWPRASSSCPSSSRTEKPRCSRAARTGSAASRRPDPARAPRLGEHSEQVLQAAGRG